MIKNMDFLPSFTRKSDNKLLRVVFNTDFRNGHDGLTKIAKALKIDTSKLQAGEFVAFVNTKKSAIKLFASGQCVAYFRMPAHRKMDVRVIGMIPKFFNGRELKYDDALKDLITKEWSTK